MSMMNQLAITSIVKRSKEIVKGYKYEKILDFVKPLNM